MQLSSRVIKQVGSDMENWPIRARSTSGHQEIMRLEEERYISLSDLNEEADLILKRAQQEAEKMLASTNEKIQRIEREAYQKGHRKGEEDALQAHQEVLEDYYQSTRQVLIEVNELRQKIYKYTEVEILALSIDIAEKLVCHQLELKPETIVDIARAACIQAKECEMVIIYAAPEQVETLKARQDEFSAQLYRSKRLEFIADSTIKSGGCRIETEQGFIDATIETMLKQLNTIIRDKS
jgi:flagellar assembly protein FliH